MQQIHDTLIEKYQMQDEQITYHVAEKKDWNEDLTGIVHKFQSLKNCRFLRKKYFQKLNLVQYKTQNNTEKTVSLRQKEW